MTGPLVGQSLRRREDVRFLTGAGAYTADLDVPGALHAAFLRSPHAHAAIGAIDAGAARAMPDVVAVFTAADLHALHPLPCPVVLHGGVPPIVPPRPVLAGKRVRHVGQAVAAVIARTPAAARDGAEAIAIDYAPLPAVVEPFAALAPAAPRLWREAPGNLCFDHRRGDADAVAAAFAAAARIVTVQVANQRVHAAPLEPRAAIAGHAGGRFTLTLAGQSVHQIRDHLAAVLHVDPAMLRVRCPDVGGGFGLKNFAFPEYALLLHAARLLDTPVRWVADSTEDWLASVHARALHGKASLALDDAGRILALRTDLVAELGAFLSGNGPAIATTSMANAMGTVYAVPAILHRVRGVFTNTAPVDAYRGAGKPEANDLMEALVEAAARARGETASTFRRRNLVRAFPHAAPLGTLIDSGDFAGLLEAAEAAADRSGFAGRRADSAACGKLRGLGVTMFLETARGPPTEWARVAVAGSLVELATGTQSNGQGHETSFVQLAADRLDLPVERLRLVQADTARVVRGGGHGGARSLHLAGGALVLALDAFVVRATAIAAGLLQAEAATVRLHGGAFGIPGTGREVGWDAVLHAAPDLAAEGDNPSDLITFPAGAAVAELEIDPETGAVALLRYLATDDYGVLVNPLLTAGQVQGGVAQGIGQALLERVAYDAESGQALSASLMDYAVPRAEDLPPLDVVFRGRATANNALGVKGAGQAGAIAAPPAVMAALADALSTVGAACPPMPATPERVWRAIRDARVDSLRADGVPSGPREH